MSVANAWITSEQIKGKGGGFAVILIQKGPEGRASKDYDIGQRGMTGESDRDQKELESLDSAP